MVDEVFRLVVPLVALNAIALVRVQDAVTGLGTVLNQLDLVLDGFLRVYGHGRQLGIRISGLFGCRGDFGLGLGRGRHHSLRRGLRLCLRLRLLFRRRLLHAVWGHHLQLVDDLRQRRRRHQRKHKRERHRERHEPLHRNHPFASGPTESKVQFHSAPAKRKSLG